MKGYHETLLICFLPYFYFPAVHPNHPVPQTLTVMTHDSFAATDTVVQAFEAANNAKVTFIKSGDAGAMLNKAILSKDSPLADVLYGVDNTFFHVRLLRIFINLMTRPLSKSYPG